eukprot:2239686-Alexandrium_andersonii.AAC.1
MAVASQLGDEARVAEEPYQDPGELPSTPSPPDLLAALDNAHAARAPLGTHLLDQSPAAAETDETHEPHASILP